MRRAKMEVGETMLAMLMNGLGSIGGQLQRHPRVLEMLLASR